MSGMGLDCIRQGDIEILIAQGSANNEDHDATITVKVGPRTIILKVYTAFEGGPSGKVYAVAKVAEGRVRLKQKQKVEQSGAKVHKSVQEIIGDPRVGVSLSREGVRVIDPSQQKDSP